ncbi:MAG: hypothetical protein CL693_09490 [Cellvibrionaceae bacterium]|nr:hypothetical protein [Cellvibrionaceae bacterium]|tara:strand:- start:7094 stop:7828 length:735 start_codon:yes stop_codon:yes gene_type:complete
MSAKIARWKFVAASILALFIQGCATPPPPPVTEDQLQTYTLDYIHQAIHADKLSSICMNLSHQNTMSSENLYQQWLNSEWDIVIGADSYYRASLSDKTLSFDGQLLAMDALRLYADEIEKANAKYSYLARVKTSPERICLRKMEELLSHTPSNPEIREKLRQQATRHVEPPAKGARIPSLAGNFTINAVSGRSHYKVEQSARDMACSSPKLITFKNQWPTEVYGAFCDTEHRLISCEWGNCKKL